MKRIVVSALLQCVLLFGTLPFPSFAQGQDFSYDIVIRHGHVLDGSGNPWILADVAIENGKHTGARPGKVLLGPGRVKN